MPPRESEREVEASGPDARQWLSEEVRGRLPLRSGDVDLRVEAAIARPRRKVPAGEGKRHLVCVDAMSPRRGGQERHRDFPELEKIRALDPSRRASRLLSSPCDLIRKRCRGIVACATIAH